MTSGREDWAHDPQQQKLEEFVRLVGGLAYPCQRADCAEMVETQDRGGRRVVKRKFCNHKECPIHGR